MTTTPANDGNLSRRGALATGVAMLAVPAVAAALSVEKGSPAPVGRHDFAFQNGNWRVSHRKLVGRLIGSTDWIEFGGTCRAWEVLDGLGNLDDHVLHDPSGTYTAATMRMCDETTGEWSIWWFDPRFKDLGPPVAGRFADNHGVFSGRDTLQGRDILVRFIWSGMTSDQARWEQAFSPDNGATWETNWTMMFDRIAS